MCVRCPRCAASRMRRCRPPGNRCGDNRELPLYHSRMAQASSFDVTTGVDLQEVDNAINQAQKEIAQRYDFKGSKATIEFKRAEAILNLAADSDFQMKSLFDVLQARLIKRGVSVKNLDIGDIKPASGDTVTREIKL